MHIDSEVHFWKYEKSNGNPLIRNNKLLARNYLPEDLSQSLQRNGMQGCIAVVAEDLEVETRFLAELAITHPEILGVIGWADLNHPKADEKILELRDYAPLRGFQFRTAQGPEPSEEVMVLLLENQFILDLALESGTDTTALNKWIKSYPEQPFVLQNCGNPDARQAPAAAWENQIRELAKNKNLSCKLSGLMTHGNWKSWKPAEFYPFLDILFDAFGPERLMYASDWPFLLLAGIYVQWKSLLEKFTERFVAEDRDLFFGENAKRIYRL
jgi:L-fuconolactonase